MVVENLPESLLYPEYDGKMEASELFGMNRRLSKYWNKKYSEYDSIISKFKNELNRVVNNSDGTIAAWETVFLKRIFGNAVNLLKDRPMNYTYEKLLDLCVNKSNVEYVIRVLHEILGLRMNFITHEEILNDIHMQEKYICSFPPDNKFSDVVALLEMLMPADRLIKVLYTSNSGLGYGSILGGYILDRGFFII